MVIYFQILLIILMALPVLALAFYLWLQIAKYVRHRNKIETGAKASGKRRKRR